MATRRGNWITAASFDGQMLYRRRVPASDASWGMMDLGSGGAFLQATLLVLIALHTLPDILLILVDCIDQSNSRLVS